MFWKFLDNIESIICRFLLSGFVLLLFVQIVSREFFGYSFSWIEELSVYMFVWFVFFGASYAALKSAHNRVTFQFKFLPARYIKWVEAFADLFWIFFNVYFIWLAYDFVFNRMNKFWKSQTLGVEMKYIYMVLPVAFTLMTIRILQVNYKKLVLGDDIADPDQIDLDEIKSGAGGATDVDESR
ncbi:TRAP-type C4-dicarboxylate transport system, small permease component [Aliiroseovarius crassostreae]|uniref:TRAP transporter small permease protein n=1 Tax=Aliiroseovarius crassostreae TaxID=154981 RepID=A0A0P7I358_9RHOB|nr:TRAP transporter small permease [Aliiroseovarius crassostreae]KPN63541.1 C4-dicarboxylate ABC transporter [Aliiroseovarius crassostreae]SFU95942.1 TRAP-type C4-dicarboxylate transport system, small permease component [Aliiroseovarius crassostreae]